MDHRGFTLIELMIVIAIIAIIAAIAVPSMMKSTMVSNERSAAGSMRHIVQMEAVFRNEDSDRNGYNDYWTLDLSGLHRILNANGNTIGKIEIPLAKADASPATAVASYIGSSISPTPAMKAGYLFRAMTTDETGAAYNQNLLGDGATLAMNTNKFGFTAYPGAYEETGKNTLIVSHEGTVWKRDRGTLAVVLTWPNTDPGSVGWGTIDY